MNEKQLTKVSKFLSLVLRHKPEIIGITLNEQGWAEVAILLEQMNKQHFHITAAMLNEVVANNNKQRFTFNEDKTKIRASQGHSIQVELELKSAVPPLHLYHGTGEKAIFAIQQTGLHKGNRHHVHLSVDIPTAMAVGKRHGKPRVFLVAAQQMHADGYPFFVSENKVWLTNSVPVQYVTLLPPVT